MNVDSKTHRVTEENMKRPDRWTFDDAAAHLYYLMTSDSYSRYITEMGIIRVCGKFSRRSELAREVCERTCCVRTTYMSLFSHIFFMSGKT